MPKPITNYFWARESVPEYIRDNQNRTVLVQNKTPPSLAMISSGVRARTPVSRGNYNYMLNSLGEHIDYLYQGEVGDTKLFAESAGVSLQDVEERFGGTWEDRGLETLFNTTLRMFEKTG